MKDWSCRLCPVRELFKSISFRISRFYSIVYLHVDAFTYMFYRFCPTVCERTNDRTFARDIFICATQWLRSLPLNPEVPSSIAGLVEGWIFGWPSFPLKFTQLSILPGSVKWVPAYMDWFEAAATCAYICFRSAGSKLIIAKRLWACYMKKAPYKCTTLRFLNFTVCDRVRVCSTVCDRAQLPEWPTRRDDYNHAQQESGVIWQCYAWCHWNLIVATKPWQSRIC